MGVTVASQHPRDEGFRTAYRDLATVGVEHGFAGLGPASAAGGATSGWLPGDDPQATAQRLDVIRRGGGRFRLLFAERYFAPAVEAHKLFVEGHLGTRIHFLAKVQAHPNRLTRAWAGDAHAWLREPVLNRLPLMVWMMGAVQDVRILGSGTHAGVVMLRHRTPGRLSILEWSVTPAAAPDTITDRFECTGSDGFLRVNGIWGPSHQPRLELHRGALETVKRDLPRDFDQVYAAAARALASERDEELTATYLEACRLLVER